MKPTLTLLAALLLAPLAALHGDPVSDAPVERSPILAQIKPTWLDSVPATALPLWYDSSRVTMHGEFPYESIRSARLNPVFTGWTELAAQKGLSHVVQAIKRTGEGAWWPTAVGVTVDAVSNGRNLAKELIDGAHKNGVKLIAYHRHMEDSWAATAHPDWKTLDENGKEILGRLDVPQLSFSSPYAQYVLTRLEELARLGVDGFYFDEAHSKISWDTYTKTASEKETGMNYPVAYNLSDPAYRAAAVYNQIVIERFFAEARRRIKAINPECVMLISIRTYDGWSVAPKPGEGCLAGERLSRLADSSKTELSKGNKPWPEPYRTFPQYANKELNVWFGYLLARDAAQGRPAHIWFAGVIKTALVYEYLTAAVVSAGNMADLSGESGPDLWDKRAEGCRYDNAISLAKKVSPAMAGTVPVRWAAIHVSDRARDAHLFDSDERKVEQCVGAALRTCFYVLQQNHLSPCFITDSELEEGVWPDTRVLCLPSTAQLSPQMKKNIDAFKQKGGLVVDASGEQLEVADFDRAAQKLSAVLLPAAQNAPVSAAAGGKKAFVAAFMKEGGDTLVINACNSFMWWPFINERKKGPADDAALKVQNTAPEPVKGLTLRIVHPAGKKPQSIIETVTGRSLQASADGSAWKITVPDYTSMAQVMIQF